MIVMCRFPRTCWLVGVQFLESKGWANLMKVLFAPHAIWNTETVIQRTKLQGWSRIGRWKYRSHRGVRLLLFRSKKKIRCLSNFPTAFMHLHFSEFYVNNQKGVLWQLQEVIDDNDPKLSKLRSRYGDSVCNAVKDALKELNEYSPDKRCIMNEVWNFREGRKATMTEVITCILEQLVAADPGLRGHEFKVPTQKISNSI